MDKGRDGIVLAKMVIGLAMVINQLPKSNSLEVICAHAFFSNNPC